MKQNTITVQDLTYIGVFTAIIAALAQISIPMPAGVPMTLQTFIIPLAGVVLGVKRGTFAALAYVLLGAIGAPVFASFSGGLGIVLGPTGGFILSFPLIAFAAGLAAEKGDKVWLVTGLVAGATLNYLCGMFWFCLVTGHTLQTAFAACVLPFLPTTAVKIAMVTMLGEKIRLLLEKSRVPA